jgi:hypothetical protein
VTVTVTATVCHGHTDLAQSATSYADIIVMMRYFSTEARLPGPGPAAAAGSSNLNASAGSRGPHASESLTLDSDSLL